jgi:anti-sigma regulatory factor (Ser/Thr protein kinase)/DNA-binding NarL/FixJ family response regulator
MGRILLIDGQGEHAAKLAASPELQAHEIEQCAGNVEALQRLRARGVDVVVTDPATSIAEDLALARELATVRPGVPIVSLTQTASREELIAALRAEVYACFLAPFDHAEIVDMICMALQADGTDGIEVVSGVPQWFTMRVSCHRLTAERLVRFMTEYQRTIPDEQRDLLIAAFREMLLNAMEHGAGFDEDKVIEVTAARTARAIVYHFRDPGTGFNREDLSHAAQSVDPDEVLATAIARAERGLRPGGFGMLITRQIADELVYNERGNEVLLIKHLT